MILFKNGRVFAPRDLGRCDVFVGGGKILAVAPEIELPASLGVEVIDLQGLSLVPGLIDGHVHIAGAGGEGGPATRTGELHLSSFSRAGVTSAVGCLGTDGFTRTIESLVMKAKGLKQDGMSCWTYTGSYQIPTPTIFDDPARDLCYVEEIIGAGEIAVADHRGSHPSAEELIRLAKHVRIGGLLAGKAGVMHIHMGDGLEAFSLLYQAAEKAGMPLTHFYPTHINRNKHLFEEAKRYGLQGFVDITTSSFPYFPKIEVKPSRAVRELLAAGVPEAHVTISSDAGGSLPSFDDQGRLEKLDVGTSDSLLTEIRDMVRDEGLPMSTALALATANPARILGLKGKGVVEVGADADLLVLDSDFHVRFLSAHGALLVRDGRILKKGMVEP